MKFFNYDEIKQVGDCRQFAESVLGMQISRDGRTKAVWRNGDNPTAIAINGDGWHDFVTEESGSIIDLCALVKFGGRTQYEVNLAQCFLGEHYGLVPRMTVGPRPDQSSRYDRLVEDGYKEKERYDYRDLSGKVIHTVVRMEHPSKPKEFLQRTPDGWGLGDTDPIMYNLAGFVNSSYVFVVEGEKDANTLISCGQPATTNAGGSKKWREEYNKYFCNKDVAILYDNDKRVLPGQIKPVGIQHGEKIAWAIRNEARSVRLVKVSELDKGDVTDYFEKEGGTIDGLMAKVKQAPILNPSEMTEPVKSGLDPIVEEAKRANKVDFRNYVPVKEETPSGQDKIRKDPRHVNDLVNDVHRRFLGFPRKVGEQLFDHDRDTGRVCYIDRASSLFSWIERKSGCKVDWTRGDAMCPREVFFDSVHAEAPRYEAISYVPDWPTRSDVYYAHPPIPEASTTHEYLEKFISFFNPVDEINRVLLKSFVTAPLYYIQGIPRPLWIIGSDRPGSGKTTLVNKVADLYGHAPVECKQRDFQRDMQEITKRLVSSEGRQSRILLVDNVTGTFKSEELSGMITMPNISGRAPYGRGEEIRPNNLTYCVTANNASVDDDLAIRAYFINLGTVSYNQNWNRDISQFMAKYRNNILADILDVVANHQPFESVAPSTRCPEFEAGILQAYCRDINQYSEVVKNILNARSESNIEEEWGKTIEDAFRHELVELGIRPDSESVWIRSAVADDWLKEAIPEVRFGGMGFLRNIAKTGHSDRFDGTVKTYPHHGKNRRRGIMWLNSDRESKADKTIVKIGGKIDVRDINMVAENTEPAF